MLYPCRISSVSSSSYLNVSIPLFLLTDRCRIRSGLVSWSSTEVVQFSIKPICRSIHRALGRSRIMCEGKVHRVVAKPEVAWWSAMDTPKKPAAAGSARHRITSPFFLTWRPTQAWRIAKAHPLLVVVALTFILVVPLERAMTMVLPGGEPYDAGFVATHAFHQFLKRRPALNDLLAAANTVLVAFQIMYILGAWLVKGRLQPALASVFMYSCRGFLGWATQLPVPRDYLGSAVDFPTGNASFFLFFSGHVGAAIITALDMRRKGRMRGAAVMDAMNVAQTVRLLATRGHYTIDLVSGAVAGWVCYKLAGWYEQGMLETTKAEAGGGSSSDLNHGRLGQ